MNLKKEIINQQVITIHYYIKFVLGVNTQRLFVVLYFVSFRSGTFIWTLHTFDLPQNDFLLYSF